MDVEIRLPKLFGWQKEFTANSGKHRLAVVSRQAGKTTVAKCIAIRELLAGRRVLWVAPTFQQLTENFVDLKNTLNQLIKKVSTPKQIDLITAGSIYFRSADKPDSIRGLTRISTCIFDEAAFATDESYAIIQPMLTTVDGRFCLISTPNGHNYFHSRYLYAVEHPDDWFVARYDWRCSPLLTQEKIDKAKDQLTPNEFRQEYEAEFISPEGALFDPTWLKDILIPESAWPQAFTRTMIGTDVSLGNLRSDLQAVVFVGWNGNTLYADCQCGRQNIDDFNKRIKQVYDKYHPEGIAFEINCLQLLAAHNLKKLWNPEPLPPIWQIINDCTKEIRIARLATLLSRGQLKILNNKGGVEAFNELSDFPNPKAYDDVLDALELGWRQMCA